MAEDDTTTLKLREWKNFGDRYAEDVVWSVPKTERYSYGVKYSFQFGGRGESPYGVGFA